MFGSCLSAIFLFTATFVLSILIMMYGWGLTPQSWWWIIGGNFLQIIIVGMLQVVGKEFNK